MTFNTGKGNEGAIALDYIANNAGCIEHVDILSGDGKGHAGIALAGAAPYVNLPS